MNESQYQRFQQQGSDMLKMMNQHALLEVFICDLAKAESLMDVKAIGTRIVAASESEELSEDGRWIVTGKHLK